VSFVHGALMWGMLAVSVPIIIHWLNRRKFQVVRWAAMEYLLKANKRNRKRLRLEHLLVLLLRCLAVALVVLAMARPVSTSGALLNLPGVQDPVERIVIIDDSGSMGHKVGRTSSFERATEAVERLVDQLESERSGDFLTVFRTSRAEPDLMLAPLERAEDFRRELASMTPSQGTFDVPETLEHVLSVVAGNDGPRQKVVYVVTDLLNRDWVGEQGLVPRALGDVTREVGDDIKFLIVDVGSHDSRNLTITRLDPAEPLAITGVPLEVVIGVTNRGTDPVFDVQMVLETGQTRVPLPSILQIEPGETEELRYRYTFQDPGIYSLTVRLPGDALALDDTRHLALEVRDSLKVLLVNGEDHPGVPLGKATDLLNMALVPGGYSTGVEPEVVELDKVDDIDLNLYHSIMLCGVERWPPEKLTDLERYVDRGGGLAIFLGDLVDTTAYSRDLYKGGQGLLPLELGRRREFDSMEDCPGILPPEGDPELVRIFTGDRNPFLRRVRGRVFFEMEKDPSLDTVARPVLLFNDTKQTPFLVEKPFGKGLVILANTSLFVPPDTGSGERGWSNWPRDPSFIVVAHDMVKLLAPNSTRGLNLATGQALEYALNASRFQPGATLAVPGEETPRQLQAEPRAGSDSLWLSFVDTDRSGVYRIDLRSRQSELAQPLSFAVNVDSAEGDLAPADPKRIESGLEGGVVQFVRPNLAGEAGGDLLTMSDGSRTELWRTLLLILAGVMLVEQILAFHSAHHERPSRALTALLALAVGPLGLHRLLLGHVRPAGGFFAGSLLALSLGLLLGWTSGAWGLYGLLVVLGLVDCGRILMGHLEPASGSGFNDEGPEPGVLSPEQELASV
jgi:Aerotolerance regulator N-terminal/von Willebrand factor type A domain